MFASVSEFVSVSVYECVNILCVVSELQRMSFFSFVNICWCLWLRSWWHDAHTTQVSTVDK